MRFVSLKHKQAMAGNFAVHGAFRVQGLECGAMAQQPPEDVGATQVLMVVAVLLVVLVIGVIVLVYDRPPAPQLALGGVLTSTCVGEVASGVSSFSCPAPLSRLQRPAAIANNALAAPIVVAGPAVSHQPGPAARRSATLLPVQEIPNVVRHQDGVDRMDHAVLGRKIADDARARSASSPPLRISWPPDIVAVISPPSIGSILSGMAFGARLSPWTT